MKEKEILSFRYQEPISRKIILLISLIIIFLLSPTYFKNDPHHHRDPEMTILYLILFLGFLLFCSYQVFGIFINLTKEKRLRVTKKGISVPNSIFSNDVIHILHKNIQEIIEIEDDDGESMPEQYLLIKYRDETWGKKRRIKIYQHKLPDKTAFSKLHQTLKNYQDYSQEN